MAHGRPVVELIENVATAHRLVSRTVFLPGPEQRYLFVVELSKPQVLVLERKTLRVLGRFGRVDDRLGAFYLLHDIVAHPDGRLQTAKVHAGGRARKFTSTGLAPAGPM